MRVNYGIGRCKMRVRIYEYKHITHHNLSELEKKINELAKTGWEIIHINGHIVWLKHKTETYRDELDG